MSKLKLDDVIVVEGKHDLDKVKQVVDAMVLITSGTHFNSLFLDQLEFLSQHKSIIVFTDNDTAGKMIRNAIIKRIPNVKHARIRDKQKVVGVEHASLEQIQDALTHCVTYSEHQSTFTMNNLYELGLNGQKNSATLREAVCQHYRIPNMNAKSLLNALNHLNITAEELQKLCQNK